MLQPKDIPVFILAGGLGTRFAEETHLKPKPMIEIGGIPILLHIMRYYYEFGFNDFVICAGYLSSVIKNYFLNYELQHNQLEVDHRESLNQAPRVFGHGSELQERWRVRVVDTGGDSMTGARVARAIDIIEKVDRRPLSTFALTYGDGLTDCNLRDELSCHLKAGQIGTVLGVRPSARFGELRVGESGIVEEFLEKPRSTQGFINGGFFLFQREFREYLSTHPDCILEKTPLENLSRDRKLVMMPHDGFWQCMDTVRDKLLLENLWSSEKCPWRRVLG